MVITAGCSPSHHHRHKSNAPRTVGDAHFEPAVMGGAGVVVQALVTKGIIATVVKNKNRGLIHSKRTCHHSYNEEDSFAMENLI